MYKKFSIILWSLKMNFLADEQVNTGRQMELDIAKSLAIIFMIILHVILYASLSNLSISPGFGVIFD